MSAVAGRVYLVGAGPGDPGLLTVRGADLLRRADAVVFDALASSTLLELVPETALQIDVGKRGHEAPTLPQEEITALLIRLAREGRTVVRLKGGDPFVFGRGGEECAALAAARIPYEVVPGVSSVVGGLAYAGIPITDRRHSASFAVVTGHKDPSKPAEQTRWTELATAADTLVVLMGMRTLPQIVERLIAGGRAGETPAAAVMNATLPSQRVVQAPLAGLPAAVEAEGLGAPSIVVVGDVVGLRETLAWAEGRPLFGRRVLVTRPRDRAIGFAGALRELGAEAVLLPLVEQVAPDDWAPLDAALAHIGDFSGVLFASRNAVDWFVRRATSRGIDLSASTFRVACVGPDTARAARAAGLGVDRMPSEHDGAALAASVLGDPRFAGGRLLLPRAAQGNDALPEALRAGGAEVDVVTAYRTRPCDIDAAALRAQLTEGALDALSFASPTAVDAFVSHLDTPALAAAAALPCVTIGRTTATALRVAGLEVSAVAERADAEALARAVVEAVRTHPVAGGVS